MSEIPRQVIAMGGGGFILSAGANCWFEQCSTDSIPGEYRVLPCLGIFRGSFCPHYDEEVDRRPSLHKFLAELFRLGVGWAIL